MKSIGGVSINKLGGVSEPTHYYWGASTNKLWDVSEPIYYYLRREGIQWRGFRLYVAATPGFKLIFHLKYLQATQPPCQAPLNSKCFSIAKIWSWAMMYGSKCISSLH